MKDKIFFEQDSQETYNIIDALSFYRDNAIKPSYKPLIDKQLENIISQIEIQGINIYRNETSPRFNFGEKIMYNNNEAIITKISNDDGFIGIATIIDNKLETIDVPAVLIKKI